jgi:hypothetical protein
MKKLNKKWKKKTEKGELKDFLEDMADQLDEIADRIDESHRGLMSSSLTDSRITIFRDPNSIS